MTDRSIGMYSNDFTDVRTPFHGFFSTFIHRYELTECQNFVRMYNTVFFIPALISFSKYDT